MKWIFLGMAAVILLPFLVKLGYMTVILYRHYFFTMINSKYPLDFKLLSLICRGGAEEKQERRKPIGFDTSFTEEDKRALETSRAKRK